MFRRDQTRAGRRRLAIRLLGFALLLGAAAPSFAGDFCSDYNGLIDGNDPSTVATLGSAITIDRDCTFQNWNPLTTTINFQTNDPSIYLIVFNNVIFTGNMACSNVEHKLWFTNGSDYGSKNSCQDLFIPVEKIDKQSPAATAAVGVPFTYRLTIPVLWDPVTGTVLDGYGSLNQLHTVTIRDDLNATGVDLTVVGTPTVKWEGSGDLVPHTYSNIGDVLTFSITPVIPANDQIIIEIPVVLDDTANNTPGKTFINTATWSFGRLIDVDDSGTYEPDEFFTPLPGENGISQPMTIAEPLLVVNKTSPDTALNLDDVASFTIDAQNTGGADAWNVTILDNLPPFSGGAGMCEYDPSATVAARIVAADGTTLIRNLAPVTDYTLSYTGPLGTPACQLSFTLTTAGGAIAPGQRLIITYQTRLDLATTTDNATLTNVAGATRWYSADSESSYPRRSYTRTLTNGTPGVVDHQDSQSVYTALAGYYFQKTVSNRTTGVSPTTTAAAGDVLRYRVRLFNISYTINGITIVDQLDPARFDLASFSMVTALPAGAIYTYNPATGLLVVTGDPGPLNLTPPAELAFEFDITLRSDLTNGTTVSNQASLTTTSSVSAFSDDPYVNGVAPPGAPADPTVVTIQAPGALAKANSRATATIGERFTYRITVPATPVAMPLYDVRILDDLTVSAADLRFVSASVVSGGSWTLSNAGTATAPIIVDAITGIDIPANGQAVIDITVELLNTADNNSGVLFSNTASYTYNRANGDAGTRKDGGAASTANMTVVEPAVTAATKTVTNVTPSKLPTDPAAAGDVLEYVVTVPNSGTSTAFDTNIADTLPANVSLVAGTATARINGVVVSGFIVDPAVLPGGVLVWGRENGDGSLDIPAGQSLVLTYRVTVTSINGAPIANSVYVDWTSLDGAYPTDPAPGRERTGAGCPAFAAPNDYCYGPVTSTLASVDTTTLAKSVVSDSWSSGGSTAGDAILRVGDTVVYRLALTLREGLLENVTVTDTLPAGLAFDGVVSVNGDTTAPYSAAGVFSYADIPATAVPAAGQTGAVTWNLGDITNAIDYNAANDGFVIEYRARVVTDTLAHVPSTVLTNNAALSYTGSDPAAARLRSSAAIEVRQPVMTVPTKTATGYTSPAIVDPATDVMPFNLESCNTSGLAPAYGITLTDSLATQLDETSITAPAVRVGGTLLTAGSDYTYTAPAVRGGTMTFVLNVPVNPGQCVTVDFSIGFYTDFGLNETWTNSVTLNEYWSLPGPDGQRYGPLGPAVFTMTNSATLTAPIKTLTSPAGNEATIGQEVVYEIRVPGSPTTGTIYDVVVTDTLNPALEYVSASVSGGLTLIDNSVGPGQVSLTIAEIPTGQQAVITLRARVANNASANAGLSFANSASYTYAAIDGGPALPGGSDATDTPLTIVEPLIAVAKGVAPGTPPSVGDVLTYTLTLTAAGGVAGDIYSNAYDASIVDTLSLGLAYVPGSAVVAGTPQPPTITGDGINTMQVLTWNGLDIAEGTAPVVTYQVRVLSGVGPGQVLRNDVRVEWTGLDGASAYERTGTGTPAYNDYFDTAYTTLTTPAPGALTKQSPATTTVAIGQPFTYTITVPPVAATTALYDVKIIDNLPAGVEFVGVSKVSAWGSWTPQNSNTATNVVITDAGGAGIDVPAGQQIVIALTVVLVNDTVTNYTGRTFTNTASYTYNQVNDSPATQQTGGSGTSGSLTIVGPDTLTLEKSGPAQMRPGVPGTFTLNVHNAGTGTAWGATVTDLLPNPTPGGMCDAAPTAVTAQLYEADGVMTVGDPLTAGSDFTVSFSGAPACTFTLTMQSAAAAIPANKRLIISYQALLDGDNVNGASLTNVAGVTRWYSADPAGGTAHTYTRTLTNGTVGTLDHEDAHRVDIETPILVFRKTVENRTTGQNPGTSASPGDVLRYTVRIENVSPVPVSSFSLVDELDRLNTPAVFQAGSLTLVTVPAGANTASTSATGGSKGTGLVDIRSLTLAVSDGMPGGPDELTVVYEATLASSIANGTVVLNQAQLLGVGPPAINSDDPNVNGADDPNVLGDEDPTRITVASASAFQVQKTSQDRTGDAAMLMPGDTLRYTITVKNVGDEDAVSVTLQDAIPANTTYVANSTTLNGAGVPDTGGNSPLQAGMLIHAPENPTPGVMRADPDPAANNVATVVFDVRVNADAADSTAISNQGFVNGSGASGAPFPAKPSDDPATAAVDDPTLDLVSRPNGIVYDSVTRQPIAGATVTMLRNGSPLPGSCFSDPAQQNQVTAASGYYKFDLNFSQPECPAGADYVIAITAAPAAYETATPSRIIAPTTSADTAAYPVPACPADAVPSTTGRCEVLASGTVPTGTAPTTYYLHLTFGTNVVDNTVTPPVTTDVNNQAFNNHVPVDPRIDGAITVTKRSSLLNVTRGQMVPYTITVKNTLGGVLPDLALVDTLPPGFKYVEGSSRFDGNPATPVVAGNGRQLRWENLALAYDQTHTIKLLLLVGAGVGDGKYVNQAQVFSTTVGGPASGIATATVRVMPDPTFDCTDIIGKVFDDANGNGRQDDGEGGVAGARVVSARGLIATTDLHGRYHLSCAVVPNESRGSNYILKLDERSLPGGYRVTTENPLVKRATRGKMIKYNFGAALHRVVRLDIADAVFEPDTTDMRPQWRPRLGILLEELKKAPSILRLSYLADIEEPALAQRRLDSIKREVTARWKEPGNGYALTIETEIYWRRGGPPDRSRLSDD